MILMVIAQKGIRAAKKLNSKIKEVIHIRLAIEAQIWIVTGTYDENLVTYLQSCNEKNIIKR